MKTQSFSELKDCECRNKNKMFPNTPQHTKLDVTLSICCLHRKHLTARYLCMCMLTDSHTHTHTHTHILCAEPDVESYEVSHLC